MATQQSVMDYLRGLPALGGDIVNAGLEVPLSLASGMLVQPAAGIVGLLQQYGTSADDRAKAIEDFSQKYTY